MKNENRSYNTGRLTVTSRKFLLPSWPKILLYILVGALLMMLLNARAIWDQFNNNVLIPTGAGSTTLSLKQAGWAQRTFDGVLNGRLAQVIFWALAGCAVYVCIWFVINIFTNIRNDIVADEFVHPGNYSRRGYWESVLARKGFLAAVIVTFIGFTFALLRVLPSLATLFLSALQPFKLSPSAGEVIGTVLAAAFLVYVLVLLAHIAFNTWRSIYSDL